MPSGCLWLLQAHRYLGDKLSKQLAGVVSNLMLVWYSQPGDHPNFLLGEWRNISGLHQLSLSCYHKWCEDQSRGGFRRRWAKPLNTEGIKGLCLEEDHFWTAPAGGFLHAPWPGRFLPLALRAPWPPPPTHCGITPHFSTDSSVCLSHRFDYKHRTDRSQFLCVCWRCSFWPRSFGAGPDRRQMPEHMNNRKHHGVGNKLPQTTPNHSRCSITEVSAG